MADTTIFEDNTEHGHYQIVETVYNGRPARVMYSGDQLAAQSGIALDDDHDLLFDYNQRLYELISGVQPERLLIIGGGAFTLPTILLEDYPDMLIDIVELDGGLLPIAEKYFGFTAGARAHVFVEDGRHYLDTTDKKYDLIVIDAFVHTIIPASLQDSEAATSLSRCLRPGGVVTMNIIAAYYGKRSVNLMQQIETLEAHFAQTTIFPAANDISFWIPQNFILTAQQGDQHLTQYFRFAPLGNG